MRKNNMKGLSLLIATTLFSITNGQLNYFAEVKLINMEDIMATSMDTAIRACQNSFKWDRWNCPSSDFFSRSSSKSLMLDHEDAYVKAIITASLLYTITKKCSSGEMGGCKTCSDVPHSSHCSDNPKAAEKLFRQHFPTDFPDSLNGKIADHNYRAVAKLLELSVEKPCKRWHFSGPSGERSKENCKQVLKPFEDVAAAVRQMYEEGLQLDNNSENMRVLWHNIPMDALLYVKDSPNYCEPYAILHWNGMRDRQCSTTINGKGLTAENRKRCRHLCSDCGYAVVKRNVVTEERCNCKLTWDLQVQCETCKSAQKQYHCY